MASLIKTGQDVTVEPVASDELQPGDIVLRRVRGRYYLHLIKAVQGNRYLIGNNRGHINGWVSRPAIFGRRVK